MVISLPIGASGLLRVAGLPIRSWLDGASPTLFELVHRLTQAEEEYRALGWTVADAMGQSLVPHDGIAQPDRALALSVRRKLHNGRIAGCVDVARLAAASATHLGADHEVTLGLAEVGRASAKVASLVAHIDAELADEQARLADLPARVLSDSPIARTSLGGLDQRSGGAELSSGAELSGGAGSHPVSPTKQIRRRNDRLWRLITRAATVSTPRDWVGQVALVRMGDAADGSAVDSATITVADEFAAHWMDSIETQRQALASGDSLASGDPLASGDSLISDSPFATGIRLAVTPLHRVTDGEIVFVTIDPLDPGQATTVSMRHTPLLGAVCQSLHAGTRTPDQLRTDVAKLVPDEDPAVIDGFIRHLVRMRILELSATPRRGLTPWGTAAQVLTQARAEAPADGWTDVYRRATASLSPAACAPLQRQLSQAMRILALITADTNHAHTSAGTHALAASEGRSVSLLDLLRARLASGATERRAWGRPPDWNPPTGTESGFNQLRAHLAGRLDADTIDIEPALLDRVGAPPAAIDWPVDCLLRLPAFGSGYSAVLDQAWPAATLDARFADALDRLDGPVPHVEAYREFIQELERLTGIRFVELLIPPLSARAANAVCRPSYTRAWTGDADLGTYRAVADPSSCYIPLDAIMLRRTTTGLIAEAGGQRIWPVYHATRSPLPPWDHVAELLLGAAPRMLNWTTRRLHNSLGLFPGHSRVPRITVDGGLVLTPAQWRLDPGQRWDADVPVATKIRAMLGLRAQIGLPRWVLLDASDGESVACDLESLSGLAAFDRAGKAGQPVIVTEMLPAPDALMLADRAHRPNDRVASELLLRLPYDETAQALAARVARRLRVPASGQARPPSAARHRDSSRREHI